MKIVLGAMYGVTQEGTSTRTFLGAGYKSGGKTGTAQAVGIRQNEKYNASKMDEYLRDHALYIAFAPLDNPRIAVAALVENAGFGAQSAAPITRRVLDYWLMGNYPSEEDIVAVQRGEAAAPIGAPRLAADVPLPAQVAAVPSTGGAQVVPVSLGAPALAPAASAAAPWVRPLRRPKRRSARQAAGEGCGCTAQAAGCGQAARGDDASGGSAAAAGAQASGRAAPPAAPKRTTVEAAPPASAPERGPHMTQVDSNSPGR